MNADEAAYRYAEGEKPLEGRELRRAVIQFVVCSALLVAVGGSGIWFYRLRHIHDALRLSCFLVALALGLLIGLRGIQAILRSSAPPDTDN